MCNNFFDSTCFDLCWGLSIIFAILPYLIIYKLKPKLIIESICINDSEIKIKVVNKGRFDAVNLRIEVCALDKINSFTFHFHPDHSDFLILPAQKKQIDNSKTFNFREISKTAFNFVDGSTPQDKFNNLISQINNKTYDVRVRVHAYHTFSGLGKSFEKYYYGN